VNPHLRACIVCGRPFTPTASSKSRCERHAIPRISRDRNYRNLAKRIIAASSHCGICGQPFTNPADPPVVDHRIPRARGGTDDPSNLQAAHKSCNGRKSSHLPATYPGGTPAA
jgi:5-methylcytosine-specific restriction endonuclease McrA